MEKELNEQALLRSNLPFNRVPGFAQKHNIALIFKYEKRKTSRFFCIWYMISLLIRKIILYDDVIASWPFYLP